MVSAQSAAEKKRADHRADLVLHVLVVEDGQADVVDELLGSLDGSRGRESSVRIRVDVCMGWNHALDGLQRTEGGQEVSAGMVSLSIYLFLLNDEGWRS